ncbi:MAG: alpha/beta fold hydrolase [Proteobacteria bacterium]|nr:alpha/beta fold hydrolase [Pseudomonadota bacterium]
MGEKRVRLESDGLKLEGLLEIPKGAARGVVVTHPHPLYGGDMHSPVAAGLARAYADAGFAALRFNFRGVGKSQGTHDHGRGEMNDVAGAVEFLWKKGLEPVHVAGYSFGAWVAGRMAQQGLLETPLVLVAPPVTMLDFLPDAPMPGLTLVVAASRDDFGPPELVGSMASRWNPAASLAVVHGADHFFYNHLAELTRLVSLHLIKTAGPPGPEA